MRRRRADAGPRPRLPREYNSRLVSVTEPGSILDEKYEIVRRLASGGMGEVFLARHVHLDELRVIKILRPDLASDPDSQKRFLREARLATQIKHPNVAILYDCSRLDDGSFYMVWEHVEGQEVGDRLAEQGPFPVAVAVDLAIQALRGLAALHATGIMHRDISPDNLMLHTDAGGRLRLKIIDLGLARTLAPDPSHEVTQVGTFMGKLRYCSPEQAEAAEGEGLDHRSDLYSLGLVVYEMVSDRFPFEGGAGAASLVQRLSQAPIPLVGRNPDVVVPDSLGGVVRRALARYPDDRFPDAIAMIQALDEVRRGLDEAATREVPLSLPAAPGGPPAQPRPRPATGPGGRPRTAELSPQERAVLLQQIDRAAARVRDTTLVLKRADEAITAGRMEEARRLVASVEESNPAAAGLPGVRERLREAEVLTVHRQRVGELESILTRYLKARQRPLAAMALDSLLDLYPNHPRRADYESWVALLDEEVAQDGRVAEALVIGREAVAADDFKRARRQLATLRRLDADATAVEGFEREIVRAEGEAERGAEVDRRRARYAELLEHGDLAAAERQLEWLGRRLPRVAMDELTGRLEEARLHIVEARFEKPFAQRLEAGDWVGAREVARELGDEVPESPRPVAMRAELDRREEAERRRASIRQGEKQVEQLIGTGRADAARLALKLLLQLDPENRRRRQFERQIQTIGTG